MAASVPFAASALEGGKRRAALSDTENLAVGAFGGVLETCIQSACDVRPPGRRDDAPPYPLARRGRIVKNEVPSTWQTAHNRSIAPDGEASMSTRSRR